MVKNKIKDYFGREKSALRIFGLSLNEHENIAYNLYAFSINFIFIFLYTALDFWEIFKHDLSGIADIVIYCSAGTASFAKTIVLYSNRKRFSELLRKFHQEPLLPNKERGGDVEQKIVDDCVWITTAQTNTYWVFGSVSIIGATVYTFIHRFTHSNYQDWEFTYGAFTVLNVSSSPNYEISAAYQCISMMTIATHFITIDLITASVVAHISYQFKMVQNCFRRIVENSYIDMVKDTKMTVDPAILQNPFEYDIDPSKIPWKYLKKSLVKAIEYHKALIEITSEMEDVFSNLLLFIFMGTLSQIGFLIYNASLLSNTIKLARSFGEIVSFSMQVATICFWGEQVMDESQKVGQAAYESNFVGTDLRFQKSIAFVIRRCQNPVKLTAGNFTNICLASFTWLMRTSYSTFMVLRHNNSTKK